MTTAAVVLRRAARVPLAPAGLVAALGAAIALRAVQIHAGLLYPDAYQYLLMARGIAESGRPLTRLGPGGDLFVPSVDAAVKPLFPALVAAADAAGLDPVLAARGLTSLTAGAVVVLCGLLTRRLTGSMTAGVAAAALCLASPAVSYWSGFPGPDPLAQALALGAALAAVERRPAIAGALAGAAACARPELGLLVAAAVAAAALGRRSRGDALTVGAAALATSSIVLLAVRPPLPTPSVSLLLAAAAATVAAAGALLLLWRASRATCAVAIVLLAGFVLLRSQAALGRADWPIALAAVLSALAAARRPATARVAGAIVIACGFLAGVYAVKNPGSDRYLANLLPAACVLAAIGLAAVPGSARRLAVAAATVVACLAVAPPHPEPGIDAPAAVAARLAPIGSPIVTAAPDAYGFLLPDRAVREMRLGERGLVVLDGPQRAYEPGLGARGTVVGRVTGAAFLRPDGAVDLAGARLVRGRVIRSAS